MKKYKLKEDTKNESQLQRVYNYKIYPKDSIITTNKRFVNIDDGSQEGSHWTFFIVKNLESYYYDRFGGQSDKFY